MWECSRVAGLQRTRVHPHTTPLLGTLRWLPMDASGPSYIQDTVKPWHTWPVHHPLWLPSGLLLRHYEVAPAAARPNPDCLRPWPLNGGGSATLASGRQRPDTYSTAGWNPIRLDCCQTLWKHTQPLVSKMKQLQLMNCMCPPNSYMFLGFYFDWMHKLLVGWIKAPGSWISLMSN